MAHCISQSIQCIPAELASEAYGMWQAETAVRCMHTILAAGENIPSLATSGLLGCFDLDRLVPVLRAHDSSRNNSSEEARAPLAYLPEICCNAGRQLESR